MYKTGRALCRWVVAAALLAGFPLATAWAGRSCEAPHPPKVAVVERGLTLAERTMRALDASGAYVVVLARAGQDLTPYGVHYSHLGFAYRVPKSDGSHVWRVLHKLNSCGSAKADLYRQGLGEFFLDDLWRYEAAWVVPTAPVQQSLLQLLTDPVRATRLHTQPYSVVS